MAIDDFREFVAEAHDNILPSPYRKIDSDIVGLDVRLEFNVSVSQFTGFYELLAPSKRKDVTSPASAVLFSKSLNFEPPNAKIDTVHREIGAVDRRVNNRKVMTKYMDRKTAVIIRHQSRDFNPEALENLRGKNYREIDGGDCSLPHIHECLHGQSTLTWVYS
ncbi:hypothetical protein RF11_07182 [Thelohanellus kitauei]|uniref:Uncharacterized protein n=1 Tax=Thelohanellus kitauei TaxID=669202 RepID=A0A0C2J8W3_THEKT|nr:hypothetical protein RF11_07182 [Thelohanellus kitauei]